MAGVSPPGNDGNYAYFSKQMNDMEEALSEESNRSRKQQEKEIENIHKSHRRDMLAKEKETEKNIGHIKDNYSKLIDDTKFNAKEQIEDVKAKARTYDRFGRYNSAENDILKRQINDMQEALGAEKHRSEESIRNLQDVYAQNLDEVKSNYRDKTEAQIRTDRASSNDSLERASQARHATYQRDLDEARKNYTEQNQQRMDEMSSERHRIQTMIRDAEKANRAKVEDVSNGYENRNAEALEALRSKQEQQIRANNKNHAEESSYLREQVRTLSASNAEYNKGRAEGTADAIRDYETQNRGQVAKMQNEHDREMVKVRNQAEDSAEYYTRRGDDVLRQKDMYFSRLIRQQNDENYNRQKDLELQFDRGLKERDKAININEERADRRIAAISERDATDRQKALEEQAKAFQDTLSTNRQQQNEQIKALETEIQHSRTGNDLQTISPAAEEMVRKKLIKEFDKTAKEEQARNQRSTESIQRNYSQRMVDALEDFRRVQTQRNYENNLERYQERSNLMAHADEAKAVSKDEIINREAMHNREVELMTRNQAHQLESQRRKLTEYVDAARADASANHSSLRQEQDFKQKMTHREFANRQSELMRDYEKKINDLKNEHELIMMDVKGEGERKLRDANRESKKMMEEQAKNYEYQLAAKDSQIKERERYLIANYEETIDKIRRSNELGNRKKG